MAILFLDTSNMNLIEKQRNENSLTVTGFRHNSGIVKQIRLSSISLPNYLIDRTTLNMTLRIDSDDLNDKQEVIKSGDHFIFNSYFAKLYSSKKMDISEIKFYHDEMTTIHTDAISYNDQKLPMKTDEQYTGNRHFVCSKDHILSHVILEESTKEVETEYTHDLFSDLTHNDGKLYLVVPGVQYTIQRPKLQPKEDGTIVAKVQFSTNSLLNDAWANAEKIMFESRITFKKDENLSNNTFDYYILFIPKDTISKSAQLFINFNASLTTFICDVDTFSEYNVKIKKNGTNIIDKNCYIPNNRSSHALNFIPDIMDRVNSKNTFGNSLIRFHKGDTLSVEVHEVVNTYTEVRDSIEFNGFYVYKKSLNNTMEKHKLLFMRRHDNEKELQIHRKKGHVNFFMGNVENVLFKRSELTHTGPMEVYNLSSVNNIRFDFFNSRGEKYPILEIDDIALSLELTTDN